MSEYKPLRSALYVPASNARAIEKSVDIDADWLIFDLEDSVSITDKPSAREALQQAFENKEFGRSQVAIRTNSVDSDFFVEDIKTVAHCSPNAILLPKVSSSDDLKMFVKSASAAELKSSVACWLMIETARGIAQLESIVDYGCDLQWRLQTLVVGHNDIASETGVSLDDDRRYLMPWLMHIVLQAKSRDVHVLDSVWNKFRDIDGFEKEASQAGLMGFDGKTLIHPSQVDIANQVFAPTEQQISHAQSIVDAFAKAENKDLNVISLNGEMIERLHLSQALKLLARTGL